MDYIDPEKVRQAIERQQDGQIFAIHFIKRDETLRKMNCRRGVTKGVTGKGMSYKVSDHPNLVAVYDMHAQGHRTISIDKVVYLSLLEESNA